MPGRSASLCATRSVWYGSNTNKAHLADRRQIAFRSNQSNQSRRPGQGPKEPRGPPTPSAVVPIHALILTRGAAPFASLSPFSSSSSTSSPHTISLPRDRPSSRLATASPWLRQAVFSSVSLSTQHLSRLSFYRPTDHVFSFPSPLPLPVAAAKRSISGRLATTCFSPGLVVQLSSASASSTVLLARAQDRLCLLRETLVPVLSLPSPHR